jgi:hypothetical protein
VDQRAADALARLKAAPRRLRLTAVEVVCGPRQHVMMSVHPLGDLKFLVWRWPGRVIGRVRDSEEWQRDGAATPDLDEAGFGPMDEFARIVSGPDADSPRGLLGVAYPVLSCACARVTVDDMLADRIYAAITRWATQPGAGSGRPIRVIAT